MPNLIIKPQNTSGNSLILQDQAGGAVLTTADSGATIANATLTTPTIASMANCTFPAGMTELVASVTASSSSTIDFNSTYVTTAHDSYELHIIGAETSGNFSDIMMKFSYDNGTNFYNFSWGSFHRQYDGTNLVYLGQSQSENAWRIGQGGTTQVGGIVRMTNMNAVGSEWTHGDSFVSYDHSATTNARYGTYSGYFVDQSSGRVNFIRLTSGSTITGGIFKLYGRIA